MDQGTAIDLQAYTRAVTDIEKLLTHLDHSPWLYARIQDQYRIAQKVFHFMTPQQQSQVRDRLNEIEGQLIRAPVFQYYRRWQASNTRKERG